MALVLLIPHIYIFVLQRQNNITEPMLVQVCCWHKHTNILVNACLDGSLIQQKYHQDLVNFLSVNIDILRYLDNNNLSKYKTELSSTK